MTLCTDWPLQLVKTVQELKFKGWFIICYLFLILILFFEFSFLIFYLFHLFNVFIFLKQMWLPVVLIACSLVQGKVMIIL